jgi:hypothetical protein
MVTEAKIILLAELIKSIPSIGKRELALKLINELIDDRNVIERQNDYLKAKKLGINPDRYETFIEKCADVISILGFDDLDMFEFDKKAINFIRKNRLLIKKQLTPDYLITLNNLYKFYLLTEEKEPETLKDLADAYTEIESIRNK